MDNKLNKRLQASLSGGIGANVVDGNLGLAIRIWKQDLKKFGILNEVFERRQFVKPSITKRDIKSRAAYKQLKESESIK